MILKKIRPEIIAVLAVAAILTYVLMVRPIIGVADNGDFPRIMNSVGLSYIATGYEDRYFGYVNREYKVGFPIPLGGGYFSTELIPVSVAVLLNQAVAASGIFDIRYLGFIYAIVFITAVFLIISGIRKRWGWAGWLAAILLIFIFADTAYTSYFNSLYGEAVTLVFLLLMIGGGLKLAAAANENEVKKHENTSMALSETKPQIWALLLFFTGAALFTGAKVQNSPVGILALILGLRFIKLRRDALWRRTAIISSIAVIVVSILSYTLVARDIRICNKYQTVFYGILKDSPSPAADLTELGLDTGLEVLAGTNYFMQEYPVDIRTQEFKKNIDKNINHLKVALFYLKHPDRLMNKLEVAAYNGFKLKSGFGNYEKYKGIAYKTTTNFFSVWSDLKYKILPHSLTFLVLFFSICGFIILYEYLRQKKAGNLMILEISAFVWFSGVMQFILPIIGDGEADLSKHLFLFNVCFDILFFGVTVYFIIRVIYNINNKIVKKIS